MTRLVRRPAPRLTLAIDPGPTQSAWVLIHPTGTLHLHAKEPNANVLAQVRWAPPNVDLAIEMIASYGMPVGAEVFNTCTWIGRFEQAWLERAGATPPRRIIRKEVCMHVCRSSRANDATIRQALIDRYGPGKDTAIGRKATPGPLYGVAGDVWSALAVAVTAIETDPAVAA